MEYRYTDEFSVEVFLKQASDGKSYINLKYNEALKGEIKKLEGLSLDYYKTLGNYDFLSSFITTEKQRFHQQMGKNQRAFG